MAKKLAALKGTTERCSGTYQPLTTELKHPTGQTRTKASNIMSEDKLEKATIDQKKTSGIGVGEIGGTPGVMNGRKETEGCVGREGGYWGITKSCVEKVVRNECVNWGNGWGGEYDRRRGRETCFWTIEKWNVVRKKSPLQRLKRGSEKNFFSGWGKRREGIMEV